MYIYDRQLDCKNRRNRLSVGFASFADLSCPSWLQRQGPVLPNLFRSSVALQDHQPMNYVTPGTPDTTRRKSLGSCDSKKCFHSMPPSQRNCERCSQQARMSFGWRKHWPALGPNYFGRGPRLRLVSSA